MIDFHCHIDLFPDPAELIKKADEAGIYLLGVTTTPKSWPHLQKLVAGKKKIRIAVGLHPELITERADEIEELFTLLPETRYVGEVGIDGSPNLQKSFQLQTEIFERILHRCANSGSKIMSIHSRNATSTVLNSLKKHPNAGQPVLHWFSGTKAELKRANDIGAWFSVGPAMLSTIKGKELLRAMPKQKVLTESDAPFARIGKRSITPFDMGEAEICIAEIWGMSLPETKTMIHQNFVSLLKSI
ncbi:MAG TPA: Qat anti-phage system TatD family nuclease QatD [Verrucomicrobiae bacterium]|nr:Qat anti-phage system TatD family nuclease QatD [Verrucomicrobiae bacterium]